MTLVKVRLLKAIVEKVVRIFDDVPSEAPEGSADDMTAGEDVPKLISAAVEPRAISELSRLKFAGKASGIPKVVRAEGAAVGAIVEEITSILFSVSGRRERTGELADNDFVRLEDSSGPRPSDRETADATVGTADVPASGLVGRLDIDSVHGDDMMDSETGAETSDDRAPGGRKVPVRVEVHSEGPMIAGVHPPRMETTAGEESVPGVPDGIDRGFSCSAMRS